MGETIVKNENCIVLPESRYVNSKPGLVWNLIKLRKSYEYDKSKIEDWTSWIFPFFEEYLEKWREARVYEEIWNPLASNKIDWFEHLISV